jgi:hypothetical protein
MRKLALPVLCACLGAVSSAFADPIVGQNVPPFTVQVLDVSAEAPTITTYDSTAAKKTTVYMTLGTTCGASMAYAERVSTLQQIYAPKEVDFIYVYANREDTLDRKIAFHREHKLGGRLIDDKGGEIAKKLGAKRTSEIFLASKDGTIVYHGAVDDSRDAGGVKQHYLQMALDETLAGGPVKLTTSPVQA